MATQEPFRPFLDNLKGYLESSNLSDAIVRCSEKEFKVHKIVLCCQSKFFSNAFEQDWKERVDNAIVLEEDDTSAVQAMLSFLYGFEYDASGHDKSIFSPMVFNVKVHTIAEKYDIQPLIVQAKDKFEKAARACWDMDDFPQAISEIYTSTPFHNRELRDLVIGICAEHIDALLGKQAFLDTLGGGTDFAADLTRSMASTSSRKRMDKYKCPSCGKEWEAVLPFKGSCYCMRCGNSRSDWKAYVLE